MSQKPICHKQLSEIQDACLSCDSFLECFPMDAETKALTDEQEIKSHLEQKRRNQDETVHRLNMKHSLRKRGCVVDSNLSTAELEVYYSSEKNQKEIT